MMVIFILTFAFYAFTGWILETVYRSIHQRRIVNPGFLTGPFLPIYGFFASLVNWSGELIIPLVWEWQFIFFVLLSTTLEYAAGWFFERFFQLQLWDYHADPFNFHGRIALSYSLLWGVLGLCFQFIINPIVQHQFQLIPFRIRLIMAIILTTYFLWDIIHAALLFRRLERFVARFQEKYERLDLTLFQRAFSPFRRLLQTYPKMRHTVSEKMTLLQTKQAALEQFIKLQRKKLSFHNDGNDPPIHY